MKKCKRCGEEKSFSQYSTDNRKPDKLKQYCKPCSNSYFKQWRTSNLEQVRKKDRMLHYIRTYNLSVDVAEALVENRTGICEICKNEDLLVVDHNHTTGKVRGFICSFCNSCLGYAKENKETLKNLIEYLNKNV
jgi:hypothetical protein